MLNRCIMCLEKWFVIVEPMNRKDEEYLFNTLESIQEEVHENNIMLHQICNVINRYLANHHQENEDDFGRNVLANLLSSSFDINRLIKR